MSEYDSIFASVEQFTIFLMGMALSSIFLQREAILARPFLFCFQFWVTPLFYLVYIAITLRVPSVIVLAVCVEIIIFCLLSDFVSATFEHNKLLIGRGSAKDASMDNLGDLPNRLFHACDSYSDATLDYFQLDQKLNFKQIPDGVSTLYVVRF